MSGSRNGGEHPIDLESSVADEMDRVVGGDVDAQRIDPPFEEINEPRRRRVGSSDRELLKNRFPEEQTGA
ncbi:MAG: hypothetical protein ACE5KM_05080 [Planctomycetaceae bacterium]